MSMGYVVIKYGANSPTWDALVGGLTHAARTHRSFRYPTEAIRKQQSLRDRRRAHLPSDGS